MAALDPGWTIGNIVAVAGYVITLAVSAGSLLVYAGVHKQKHEEINKQLNWIIEQHNSKMATCPVLQIEERQDVVRAELREIKPKLDRLAEKEELRAVHSKLDDLLEKNRRLDSLEALMVASREDRQRMNNKLDEMSTTMTGIQVSIARKHITD